MGACDWPRWICDVNSGTLSESMATISVELGKFCKRSFCISFHTHFHVTESDLITRLNTRLEVGTNEGLDTHS